MLYDGDCPFCRRWTARLHRLARGCFDVAPYQTAAERFPRIPREDFAKSVFLVEPDGEIYKGACAVYRILAYRRGWGGLLWLYQRLPGFAPISEACYRWVARHRGRLSAFS